MRSLLNWRPGRGQGVTLLVPFCGDGGQREKVWEWLQAYWEHELPGAEIVMGSNDHVPFSKTTAVNQAFSNSRGNVVVILDADCYLPGSVITGCAKRIRAAQRRGKKLWFIPYRHFYRMTAEATADVLKGSPSDPLRISDPPPPWMIEETSNGSSYGHWFGALVQIMPREAFEAAGEMDERFCGWGAEDISFMMAVDTLYVKHRTTSNGVLHLWHPHQGTESFDRMWEGQAEPGGNNPLASRYGDARGRSKRMHQLTREPGVTDSSL